MNVVVRYFGQLRRAAGRGEERASLPDPSSVADLVKHLAQNNERLRGVLLDNEGEVRASLLVFVGDEQAGKQRPLTDGDEVTLMTPIAGGA
jgi:molybdopterin converting factor small subunit